MAGLKVEANLENTIENIVALREEIDRLKKSLIEVAGVPNSDKVVKKLEAQLQKAMKSLREYQSKYSQLKKAYDDVIGSEETIKKVHEETKGLQSTNQWIVANTKAVKEADAEIKKLKNNFKGLTDEEKTGEKGYGILRQVEYQVAVRKKEEEAIRRTIKAQKEQIIQSESEEGSITSLRKQLNQLIITYDNIGRANRNGGVGKDLLTQIKAVQTELNAAEQATGRFQRNVGNYSSAFNGLGMSIQQIARELPSATMGINMFFLAISNNLPIFFDEVQKARKEYAAYLAELSKGNKDIQKVAPVWKQLAAGIFSWNTALVVGITLLTAYGKEIFDYIGGLFSAKSALLDLLTAEQEMALARKEAVKSTAKERVELDILYNKLKNVSLSAKERTAAINEWLHKYPQYANILENEKVNLGNLESAYRTLSKEIYANAVARNYADKMADLSVKKEKEEMKRLVQKATLMKAEAQVELAEKEQEAALQARRQGLYGSGNRVSVANDNLSAANKNLEKQQKIYDDIVKNVKTYDDNLVAISNHINTLDLFPQPQQGTYEYWTQQKQRAESVLKEIKSDVKRTLDDAFKKGADFSSLEVDEAVIETYVKAVNEIKEAERELKAYDSTSKQEDTDEKLIKQQEQLAEQLLSIRRKNQQDEINLMEDGTEKKLAQIDLDYQKELDAIKKQRKEWEDAQGGKLTEEQTLVIDLRKELAGKKKDSDTSKVHEEEVKEYQKLLSSYQDYLTKRKNTEDKFNADRKKLKDGGASDAQINELEYQRDETLKSIDNEFAMREDSFKAWTDNIANLSLEKLRELLVQAERELERSEFLNPNEPKLAGQRAKVTSLKNIINEKASKTDTSPGKRSQKEWQDLYKTLSKVEKEFDEIGKTVGGTAGEIISAAGSIASSTLQMIDGITTLANSSSDAMAGTAQAASKSIQAVEKASVILAIVGAALQITTKMFDLFGGDTTTEKYEEAKEAYQSYINILDKVIDKQLELAESLSGDNAQAAYDRAIELVKTQSEAARVLGKQYLNSGSSWKSHSKGYKEVDDMSAAGWADAAKALGMSVSQFKSAMGGRMTGLFDLTDEQLAKLQEEAHIFWAQLDSDTQNYANQIAEGVAQVKEVLEQQMTDTTLIDVDTLRNDFHDLLTDMDADSADFADNFEDYMRNAILNSMLKESYMGRLEEWRKKFYAAMDDGVTEQEYNALKEEGQQIADEMKAQRDAMAEIFGWTGEATQQSASSRGFQSMSQDTGEELNGRFTALQIAGEEIKNQNIAQSQSLSILNTRIDTISSTSSNIRDIASETRDIIARSYLELVQISENTGAIVKPVQQMQKDIAEVKKNTSKL